MVTGRYGFGVGATANTARCSVSRRASIGCSTPVSPSSGAELECLEMLVTVLERIGFGLGPTTARLLRPLDARSASQGPERGY